jgi:cytochrome P450
VAALELSPFGLDLHACLGARMTLVLGQILAWQLIHAFDWDVVDDGPKERGNRHWAPLGARRALPHRPATPRGNLAPSGRPTEVA